MTPKEKAHQLFNKANKKENTLCHKVVLLITDEILNALPKESEKIIFWNDVKKEIEKEFGS